MQLSSVRPLNAEQAIIAVNSRFFVIEKYNVKAEETTVSGLSSGAFMAVQFRVSFSVTIRGAGITAGGAV